MLSRVSTSAVRPDASVRPSRRSTSAVAHGRRQVEVVRREHQGAPALAVQARDERRDLELVRQVQRRGRLVEQQHVGRLRQRGGNHHALLLAAAERVERRASKPRRARCRERLTRKPEIVGSFDFERPQVRVAAHQHHLEHRVRERRMRLLRNDGDAPGDCRPPHRAIGCAIHRTTPAVGPSTPASILSSVVFPDPFGPRMPTAAPRSTEG